MRNAWMKIRLALLSAVCLTIPLAGCSGGEQKEEKAEYSVALMKQELLDAAANLEPSENLYFADGLEITGLGVTYDGRPTAFDGCYYWPAIEKLTNAYISIDWHEAEGYASSVATTLLLDVNELPDIINPYSFGIMDLADDGLIVPLDEYLELMPDIVAAVGEDRMDTWRQADGHIYFIPTVSAVQGSQSMMVRKDWLDALGMDEPESWEDWLALWRGIRDNDLNGNGDTTDEIP
ncbi:MAG: extracellular solute-binding protein, partial [Anaerotignum sp.]